uniref:Uncharacterized protein n=1 Tax=Glossina brevipalpis TaxID=37001 RepID=A0A1A9WK17_9MUSC
MNINFGFQGLCCESFTMSRAHCLEITFQQSRYQYSQASGKFRKLMQRRESSSHGHCAAESRVAATNVDKQHIINLHSAVSDQINGYNKSNNTQRNHCEISTTQSLTNVETVTMSHRMDTNVGSQQNRENEMYNQTMEKSTGELQEQVTQLRMQTETREMNASTWTRDNNDKEEKQQNEHETDQRYTNLTFDYAISPTRSFNGEALATGYARDTYDILKTSDGLINVFTDNPVNLTPNNKCLAELERLYAEFRASEKLIEQKLKAKAYDSNSNSKSLDTDYENMRLNVPASTEALNRNDVDLTMKPHNSSNSVILTTTNSVTALTTNGCQHSPSLTIQVNQNNDKNINNNQISSSGSDINIKLLRNQNQSDTNLLLNQSTVNTIAMTTTSTPTKTTTNGVSVVNCNYGNISSNNKNNNNNYSKYVSSNNSNNNNNNSNNHNNQSITSLSINAFKYIQQQKQQQQEQQHNTSIHLRSTATYAAANASTITPHSNHRDQRRRERRERRYLAHTSSLLGQTPTALTPGHFRHTPTHPHHHHPQHNHHRLLERHSIPTPHLTALLHPAHMHAAMTGNHLTSLSHQSTPSPPPPPPPATMLRPMLPDILHNHFPPPYSALPCGGSQMSNGTTIALGPPPPLPSPSPHGTTILGSASPPPPPSAAGTTMLTSVISTVPMPGAAAIVNDGRFTLPLPIIRSSSSSCVPCNSSSSNSSSGSYSSSCSSSSSSSSSSSNSSGSSTLTHMLSYLFDATTLITIYRKILIIIIIIIMISTANSKRDVCDKQRPLVYPLNVN